MRLVVLSALLFGAVSQIRAALILDCCFRPGDGGFLFNGDTYSPIIVAGSLFTGATGINNAGQIVGFFSLPGDVPGTGLPTRGFVYDSGTLTSIEVP